MSLVLLILPQTILVPIHLAPRADRLRKARLARPVLQAARREAAVLPAAHQVAEARQPAPLRRKATAGHPTTIPAR